MTESAINTIFSKSAAFLTALISDQLNPPIIHIANRSILNLGIYSYGLLKTEHISYPKTSLSIV